MDLAAATAVELPVKMDCIAAVLVIRALLVAVVLLPQVVQPVATGVALKPDRQAKVVKVITAVVLVVAAGLAAVVPAMVAEPAVPTMPIPTCVPTLHIPAVPVRATERLHLTILRPSVPVPVYLFL
jgi:hypothetical protein